MAYKIKNSKEVKIGAAHAKGKHDDCYVDGCPHPSHKNIETGKRK